MSIFKSNDDLPQDKWYLGNIFMKKYYMAFDMSPYEERNQNYLQVGIGELAAADYKPKFKWDPEDDKVEPVVVNPSNTNDQDKDEGGGSFGTVILWLFILGLIGGGGYLYYRYREK